ncbi:GGDEF domain-containing protein [Brucella pituitosa]|uniref:GGDEF domain-containing protein n=1 Tax=Brucella pituitosa TaxID=571256 RepID=UPI003F4AD6F5
MFATMNLDQQTMFTINALLLVVFAIAFSFAGLGAKDRTYWLYMVASNIVLAVAFFMFSQEMGGSANSIILPNLLLFVGLSFRWIAIRVFFSHSVPLKVITLIPLAASCAFLLRPLLGNGPVFGVINLLIAMQILAIIWTIVFEKEDLKSRWGLCISYAVLVLSSFLRTLQGWIFDPSMDSLLPIDIFLQLNLIAAAIHISASGAFSLLIAYERSVNNLREIALRDPLTGLLNRWSIETFSDSMPGTKKTSLVSVIMIDIDHFKSINDTYGHSAGDAALKHCAKVLKETFKENDMIARVGGEEFMILAPGLPSGSSADLCEIFRTNLAARPFSHNGIPVPFTVSIGIYSGYMKERTELDIFWENADKALYKAKSLGRNKTELFEENDALL